MVQAKFQVDVEQICLLMGQRILGDEEVLRDLDLEHGSEILLAIRYYPQSSVSDAATGDNNDNDDIVVVNVYVIPHAGFYVNYTYMFVVFEAHI